jgi:hypothetical protein
MPLITPLMPLQPMPLRHYAITPLLFSPLIITILHCHYAIDDYYYAIIR